MVSDQDRRELYLHLEQAIGRKAAGTMMELLPPVGWGDVARQSDLLGLRAELRGEMAELRGEVAELRSEMRAQLPKLIAANLGGGVALATLVLAAAKLA